MSSRGSSKGPAFQVRPFNKTNLLSWVLSLENDGFVQCSFKHCIFLALDVDEMYNHYVYCSKENVYSNICPFCKKATHSRNSLCLHKIKHHFNDLVLSDIEEYLKLEKSIIPSSSKERTPSYVLRRSWEVHLKNKQYIKCFVPFCFYTASTVDDMMDHFMNSCVEEKRKQLVFSCPTCHGGFKTFEALNEHHNLHSTIPLKKRNIPLSVITFWKSMLEEFSWMKCSLDGCRFIDSNLEVIAAHHRTCTSSSKGFVTCSKCLRWFVSSQKLVEHTLSLHNLQNSYVKIDRFLLRNYASTEIIDTTSAGNYKEHLKGLFNDTDCDDPDSNVSESCTINNDLNQLLSKGKENKKSKQSYYCKNSTLGEPFNNNFNFGIDSNSNTRDSSTSEDSLLTEIRNIKVDDKNLGTSISDLVAKIAPQIDAPLIPIDVSVEKQESWTMYVPKAPLHPDHVEELGTFEKRFWDNVIHDMDDIITMAAPFTSVRNTKHKSLDYVRVPATNYVPSLVSCGTRESLTSPRYNIDNNTAELLSDDEIDSEFYFSGIGRSSLKSNLPELHSFHEPAPTKETEHQKDPNEAKSVCSISLATETQNTGESGNDASSNSRPSEDSNENSNSTEHVPSSDSHVEVNHCSSSNAALPSSSNPSEESSNVVTVPPNHNAQIHIKDEPPEVISEIDSADTSSFMNQSLAPSENTNGNIDSTDVSLTAEVKNEVDIKPEETTSTVDHNDEQNDVTVEQPDPEVRVKKKVGRKPRKSSIVRKLQQEECAGGDSFSDSFTATSTPAQDTSRPRRNRKRRYDAYLVPEVLLEEDSLSQSAYQNYPDGYMYNEELTPYYEEQGTPVKVMKTKAKSVLYRRKKSVAASSDALVELGPRITAGTVLDNPSEIVVHCAVCSEEMTAADYMKSHVLKHTFLCWLEGEQPLPLDNYPVMTLYLNRWKKVFPKLPFRCPRCGEVKKSAVGFISHYQFCGKSSEEMNTLKSVCPVCKRMFRPSNIDQHMFTNHTVRSDVDMSLLEKDKKPEKKSSGRLSEAAVKMMLQSDEILPSDLVDTNIGSNAPPVEDYKVLREKWKTAFAMKNIVICPFEGCDFAAGTLNEIRRHYKNCSFNGSLQPFVCKECNFKANTREALKIHVKKEHSNEEPTIVTPGEIVFPIPALREVEDNIYSSFGFLRQSCFFRPAIQWTFDLRNELLSKDDLFPGILFERSNFVIVEDLAKYTHTITESVMMKFESSEWNRLIVHQNLSEPGNSGCLFTGGPIWAMAWAPTPDGAISEQFLAVATHLRPGLSLLIGQVYAYPSVIQVWSFGLLINNKSREVEPTHYYSLCLDGCVWDMCWCPSGCYSGNRLGLLAVALSTGEVHVFALPQPHQISQVELPMYNYKPNVKLLLRDRELYQCKRVSWSKVKPHNLVVGGYTNGMVAVWNLNVTSTLLRQDDELYPCIYFKAHHSVVTGVSMCPISNNFLLTVSMDRNLHLWDLRATDNPLQTASKGTYTDADWLSHWAAYITSVDGGYVNATSTGLCTSVRDFSFLSLQMLNSYATTAMSVSASDWLNAAAFSFEDGNVVGMFGIRQMGGGSDSTKKRTKYIVQCKVTTLAKADTKKKLMKASPSSQDVPTDSSNYDETSSMFGLQFSLSKRMEDCLKTMKNPEDCRYDIYSIQRANKVCFNPNAQSFLSLAVGYESGFLLTPTLLLPMNASHLANAFIPEAPSFVRDLDSSNY